MSPYRLTIPALGVPAMSATHGSLGWSSCALLIDDTRTVIVDTGGPGYRALWDGWLAAEGRTRFDVDRVFVTHTHWDHVGALPWFPRARITVSQADLAWALGAAGTDPFLEPAMISMLSTSSRVDRADPGDVVDGVRVIATPGHTPGHVSFATGTQHGALLVVGDAVKNGDELKGGPFAMTMDARASDRSRDVVRSAASVDGMSLLLGHDGLFGPDLEEVSS